MAGANRADWESLWRRLGARGDAGTCLDMIVRAYSEPHRAYHNLNHIADCLAQLAPVPDAGDRNAVELALWLHDVVYVPGASDNEGRSAAWAVDLCRSAALPPEFGRRVSDLILATRHDVPATTPDAQLMVDVDLSILGREPAVFDGYEAAIRLEYRRVPQIVYRLGRGKILRGFLARPAIFTTAWFHSRYESAARHNIERSLARL
jgi:predicted metal-dependent HD superfamily phosphohydrolase